MNRKALSLVLAGVLSASAVFPAFATSGGAVPVADGTEVWAGIVIDDPDARIKVEVPTLFAFVVNGVVSGTGANQAVTVDNNGLLLPNVKVKVDDPTISSGNYSIQTVGDGIMQFTNYSTTKSGSSSSGRTGLKVTLNGNIKNEGDLASRNYWEHVDGAAISTAAAAFKKYNVTLGNKSLSTAVSGGLELAADDVIALDAPINIEDGSNLDFDTATNTGTNLALSGRTKTVAFGVAVGGTRGQYSQVEESAKVGTIVWTISADIENNGVETAPSNTYLPDEPAAQTP